MSFLRDKQHYALRWTAANSRKAHFDFPSTSERHVVQRDFVVFLPSQERNWFHQTLWGAGEEREGNPSWVNWTHSSPPPPKHSQKSTQGCRHSPPESTEPQLRMRKAPLTVKYISQALDPVLQAQQVRQPSPWGWAVGIWEGQAKGQ